MKKLVLIVLTLICLLSAVGMVIPISAASSYIRGDADGDGEVTITDATVIQRTLANIPTASFFKKAADVDGDGLNITDATQIQRYLAEFDNIYHINETVTIPDPTVPQPTRDPYELPVDPNK
ncbi:MAG: dockerin type I repeat-containing protein [Ruminococcus sp.]|uniref:dockerin type I repeat-containing protein n=1 Tax=Ruminococcus sp. TaxID=41978 RepID=UPI0028734D39|nr:dockerin type I repeat-containing protein [Ruminococcus sp.]MBQ3286037.1 dockerin type I repeat-containing protein [Ruminococcus sp.]